MMIWWQSTYFLRRQLNFTAEAGATIGAGYPLFVIFNYTTLLSLNKTRTDFADIEIVYWDSSLVTPAWQVLGRTVYLESGNLVVKFNAYKKITTTDNNYYIYMGNSSLQGAPIRPAYVPNDYPVDTSTAPGLGLTFTRPTEDWENGLSQVADAKASFSFFGVNAQVVVENSSDRGFLKLILDDTSPILIDTFSTTTNQSVVYTTSGLSLKQHYIRLQTTGDKNPSSTGTAVKIVKIQYSKYTQGVVQIEEINSAKTSIRTVVGP